MSQPMSDLDRQRMDQALALAALAIGVSDPNPRVGCVIGKADGTVLAQGHTQAAGQDHAEAAALRAASSAGTDLRGATAWVTLEPCSHHGRTPPCCDALLRADIARVVVAGVDPNPLVAGGGLARLREAGVQVDMADADQVAAARELNIGFFSRMERGRPWVRMKVAASLDGRTALHNGVSQWITGEAARTDGHAWRKRANAVLTGIGTVLEDDPRLDVRLVTTELQPLRVVIDSRWQTPMSARILPAPGKVRIYGAVANAPEAQALAAAGCDTRLLAGANGKVDLSAVLQDLGASGINELHVEAGHKLNGSFLREGLVDELLLYMAPKLLGPGRELAALPELTQLQGMPEFRFTEATLLGSDLRLRARR